MMCGICKKVKLPKEYHTEAGERKLILLCWRCDGSPTTWSG